MKPFVSVIVPIRNEEKFVGRCLTAILSQTYPAERVEIVVADGMSEDRTREVIRTLRGSERVRVVDNPARLQAAGLNLCIKGACGDILVRVDGHTLIAPDYIEMVVEALRQTGAWNVGGAIANVGTSWMGRAIAAAATSSFGVPGPFHGNPRAQFTDTVYMGAWPRAVFDKVGLFSADLAINEDYELNHRIREAGGKVYYDPAIRSEYFGRQTLRALARQYFRYGAGKVEMLARYPKSLKWRHCVAPAFVVGLLLGPAVGIWLPSLMAASGAIVGSYAAVNTLAAARVARRKGWELLVPIGIAFGTMHVAWGIGFWLQAARTVVSAAGRREAASPWQAQSRETANECPTAEHATCYGRAHRERLDANG